MDSLVFDTIKQNAPENFVELYDVYFIYNSSTVYRGVIYKAWGTEPEEAEKKVKDLITLDKVNGIIRLPGEVVE